MIVEKIAGDRCAAICPVAPLVMSVPIIRQNNNYPFKTSRKHLWFIALERGEVKVSAPVERKTAGACIDNYYLAGDSSELLTSLIEKAKEEFAQDRTLYAISHIRHVDAFQACGFLN